MIYAKSTLAAAVKLSTADKPALVHFAPSGVVMGTCREGTLVLTAPANEYLAQVPLTRTPDVLGAISAETLSALLRMLPPDKTFGGLLEHVDIAPDGRATLPSGSKRVHVDAHKIASAHDIIRYVAQAKEGAGKWVLNRRRLALILDAISIACPDTSGESPIFAAIPEGGGLALRAVNYATGTRAYALIKLYEADWLKEPREKRKSAALRRNGGLHGSNT